MSQVKQRLPRCFEDRCSKHQAAGTVEHEGVGQRLVRADVEVPENEPHLGQVHKIGDGARQKVRLHRVSF